MAGFGWRSGQGFATRRAWHRLSRQGWARHGAGLAVRRGAADGQVNSIMMAAGITFMVESK
jgi:hypothetical protein